MVKVKGAVGYATKNFKWSELQCRCCGFVNVEQEALEKLQAFREIIGVPFAPLSASRCPRHNAKVGGAPKSQHIAREDEPSKAFDVPLVTDKDTIIKAAMKVGFNGIGISYKTFVHMDNRKRRTRW